MELDEEFGKRLQETENKAQVPQAHHLASVLDFLQEPGLEAGLQDGAELLCVCVCVCLRAAEKWER